MRFASKDAEETVEKLQDRMRMNRIRHTKFRPGLANSYAKYFFEGIYVPNKPESENFKTCNDMILKSGNYLKVFDKNKRPLDELVQFNAFIYKKVFGRPMPNSRTPAPERTSPTSALEQEPDALEQALEISEDTSIDPKLYRKVLSYMDAVLHRRNPHGQSMNFVVRKSSLALPPRRPQAH